MKILKPNSTGFLFLFLLFVLPAKPAGLLQKDSLENRSSVSCCNCSDSTVRQFNIAEIDFDRFYQDKSMQYGSKPLEISGFWGRWLGKLLQIIVAILSQKATPVILYVIVFSACAYILIRFLRGEAESVWQSNKEKSLLFSEEGTQLTGTDLSILLKNEVSAGNYNKAVRILFLQTIQHLVDHGFITIHPEKTNHTFIHEIKDAQTRDQFRQLTRIYEFSWFGKQSLDKDYFERIAIWFDHFNSGLNG